MAEQVKFYKVASLPGTLEADSFYFVANGDYAESYVTDNAGVAKSIGNSVMIEEVASELLGGSKFQITDTITTRDAIDTSDGLAFLVLVVDATLDATVNTGGALYAWDPNEGTSGEYKKVAEYESMDIDFSTISIDWSQITNGPTSTPAQIDQAVTDSHTHANKTELDKVGEDGSGYLTYDGTRVGTIWDLLNW